MEQKAFGPQGLRVEIAALFIRGYMHKILKWQIDCNGELWYSLCELKGDTDSVAGER